MNKLIGKVVMHRDRKITVRQSVFNGTSHDAFVTQILSIVPKDCEVATHKSGTCELPSIITGGLGSTVSGVTIVLKDPTQAPTVRKALNAYKGA